MGYHIRKIKKGTLGELSKLVEEFEELVDSLEQKNKIMAMVELSDLYGAMEAYAKKHFKLKMSDLRTMAKATQRAFKSGSRK
jgi:ATP phosphoribosyltransferase regulatory subunit HisZ